jgi:hypothetical protein
MYVPLEIFCCIVTVMCLIALIRGYRDMWRQYERQVMEEQKRRQAVGIRPQAPKMYDRKGNLY